MLSVETALRLREAGVAWQPSEGDRFVVPGSGLEEKVFVINDMATMLELYRGYPVVTFHGTPEWALDFIWLGETVWIPSETQLREMVSAHLGERGSPVYDLLYADDRFTCRFELNGEGLAFSADGAEEAYAAAVLHLLG